MKDVRSGLKVVLRSSVQYRKERTAAVYSKPSCVAFKVAAARVEHSNLRNTLSMRVRTVLGLMDSFCAAVLSLAPRLIQRNTSRSRSVRRLVGSAVGGLVLRGRLLLKRARTTSAS